MYIKAFQTEKSPLFLLVNTCYLAMSNFVSHNVPTLIKIQVSHKPTEHEMWCHSKKALNAKPELLLNKIRLQWYTINIIVYGYHVGSTIHYAAILSSKYYASPRMVPHRWHHKSSATIYTSKFDLNYGSHYCVKMMHAYPQMKDLTNVQKCYALIIDNPCDLRFRLFRSISNRFWDMCKLFFFKFSKTF